MVLTHDTDEAIKREMIRATARNIQATQVDVAAVGYDRTVYYTVGAFSHTGSHRVALHYTADGVTAVCDCEAGQQGRICQHVAAALRAEEMPQDPEGAPPAPEPIRDTADEIRALAERKSVLSRTVIKADSAIAKTLTKDDLEFLFADPS